MTLSEEHLRWFRQRRSGLVAPFASPEEAASRLVGVQAQILPAAGLALWNRTPGLTHALYDRLLHDERRLVKLWGQRHTLHLYPSSEWPLVCGALTDRANWWRREMERRGEDATPYLQLLDTVEGMLRERGTLGRGDLRAADLPLETWHLSAWGGLFSDLVLRGHACHAPAVGGEGRFAHRQHWLPDLPWTPPPVHEANVELARRYFATYGPATLRDLAYWRGATVKDARQWATALGEALVEVDAAGQPMLALRDDLDALHEPPPPREAWPVRMLYRFDPLLLGLKDKGWLVEPHLYSRVWRPAGHIEGTLLEHGRIVGTWRYDRVGRRLAITVRPFAPLPAHARAAIEQHSQGVADFFALPLAG